MEDGEKHKFSRKFKTFTVHSTRNFTIVVALIQKLKPGIYVYLKCHLTAFVI